MKNRFVSSLGGEEAAKSVLETFKILEKLGLGKMGGRGGSCTLLKPENADVVGSLAGRLAALFRLPLAKVAGLLNSRDANPSFDQMFFDEWFLTFW